MARPEGTKKNGLKYLTEEQLKAFNSALNRYGSLRDQVMMNLGLYLGLRVGELARLRIADIEPDSHQITIEGLKSGRKRSYPDIEEKLWAKLTRYLRREKPEDRVFLLSVQAMKNVFKKYAKLAGLNSGYSIHSLRHTCGMLRAKRGDSPVKIMLWLRHRDIKSTQRYFEQTLFERDSEEMNALMGEYL